MIRGLIASVADNIIIPLQDYLDVNVDLRMYIPDTIFNNFRIFNDDLSADLSKKINDITKLYGRA